MYDHIGIKVKDLKASAAFYAPVLEALGHVQGYADETTVGFGPQGAPALWLYPAKQPAGPGTHIALDQGDTFGPFIAGDNGVVLFEVMMGDPRSFSADAEGYERFLAERNVEQLPNPPIDMPTCLAVLFAPPAAPDFARSTSDNTMLVS